MSGEFRPARKVERLSDCLEDRLGEIAMAVKMRPTYTRTKRPRGALLQLGIVSVFRLYRIGGSFGDSVIPLFLMIETHHFS